MAVDRENTQGTRSDGKIVYSVEPKFSPMSKWIFGVVGTAFAGLLTMLATNAINDNRTTEQNARDALNRVNALSQRLESLPTDISGPIGLKLDRLSDAIDRVSSKAENSISVSNAQEYRKRISDVNSQQWEVIRETRNKVEELEGNYYQLSNQIQGINGKLDILISRSRTTQEGTGQALWEIPKSERTY